MYVLEGKWVLAENGPLRIRRSPFFAFEVLEKEDQEALLLIVLDVIVGLLGSDDGVIALEELLVIEAIRVDVLAENLDAV